MDERDLTAGAHTFSVRAIGADGKADSTPAHYTWTVDASPPKFVHVTPSDAAKAVPLNAILAVRFNEGLDPATITAQTFTLKVEDGGSVDGNVTYDAAAKRAAFDPANALAAGTTYTATVRGGDGGAD